MFFLYSLWGFFYIILSYTHVWIEKSFLLKNNPFLVRRRTFKYISYFEKLILVFFYKKGWFENSIANLFRKKDIVEYRRNFYPIIQSFHINYNKVDYKISDLRFFVRQYKYYSSNKILNKKINKVFKICYSIKNKNFIKYLMLQHLYINRYYNYNSYNFFNYVEVNNIIKFNRIFFLFLMRSSNKLVFFNLGRWYDWYNFNFNKNIVKYFDLKTKLTKKQKKTIKEFKTNRLIKWINIVFKYKKRINNYNKFFKLKFKGIIFFRFNYISFFKIKINKDFLNLLKYYTIKFSESSVTKYINSGNLKNYNIQYLRKNRIFNKGRYSRNRQLYRTGVYWCLWLNIIMVYGLYFMFYRFTFNFGYFWWGILFLAYSTIFSRIVKYNFYNINYILKEFNNLIKWYGSVFNNLIIFFENITLKYFKNILIYNYIALYKNNSLGFIYNYYYYYFVKFFKKLIDNRKKMKIVYMWQGMKEKDNSFLRYKTIIHWIKEIWRLIIT